MGQFRLNRYEKAVLRSVLASRVFRITERRINEEDAEEYKAYYKTEEEDSTGIFQLDPDAVLWENDRNTDKWDPFDFVSSTEEYVTGHDLVFLPVNAMLTSSELGICQRILSPSMSFHLYQYAGRVRLAIPEKRSKEIED